MFVTAPNQTKQAEFKLRLFLEGSADASPSIFRATAPNTFPPATDKHPKLLTTPNRKTNANIETWSTLTANSAARHGGFFRTAHEFF